VDRYYNKHLKRIGEKQGKLTIIDVINIHVESKQKRRYKYIVQCDCGTIEQKDTGHYNHRKYTQCKKCSYKEKGSIVGDKIRKWKKPNEAYLKRIWGQMIRRCTVQTATQYNRYGGRGIKVCNEWITSFNNFYTWAINSGFRRPLEIDRIDNDGNYEPSNCKWSTRQEQVHNRHKPCNKTSNLPKYITLHPSKTKPYKVQCKGNYLGCYSTVKEAEQVANKFIKEWEHAVGIN